MKYMMTWVSRDTTESIKRFQQHHEKKRALTVNKGSVSFEVEPGVKILESLHVVGSPTGFVLLEVTDAASLQKLIVQWSDVLEVEVALVVNDEEAFKSFGHTA